MAREKKEKAPSIALVRMLCTLIDHNAIAHSFSSTYSSGSQSWSYRGTFPKDPSGRDLAPDLHTNVGAKALELGLIVREKSSWNHGTTYVITDAGREFGEKWRHLLAEKPDAKYIILQNVRHSWISKCHVGPLCKVIRRTGKRVYVEVVQWGTQIKADPKTWRSSSWDWCPEVHGNAPNEYVEVNDILYEDVPPAAYLKIYNAAVEYDAWKETVKSQEKAEIEDLLEPIKKRYEDRRVQKDAEFAEEIKEFMKGK